MNIFWNANKLSSSSSSRRRGMMTTAATMTGLRKWGGLLFVVLGVGGLFLVNSVLMYDKLTQVDDDINSGNSKHDDWISLASITARQRHLAVVEHSRTDSKSSSTASSSSSFKSSGSSTRPSSDAQGNSKPDKNRGFVRRNDNPSTTAAATSPLQLFQSDHPPTDTQRIRDFVHSLRDHDFDQRQRKGLPYNIYNCPETPPQGYPMVWKALDVLEHWGVDDTDLPSTPIYQGLCVFDWDTEQTKAENYRAKELPFVLKNHPGVMETAERWMTPDYLHQMLGEEPQRNEHGKNNHLMFWRTLSPAQQKQMPAEATLPPNWKPPTDTVMLTFLEWQKKANALMQDEKTDQAQRERFYFRLNAFRQTNHFLYDEMPFFDPEKHKDYKESKHPNKFLIVDEEDHRGINCRFGQPGIIAEAHFDSTRNFVVLLGGQRRYILAHPDQCNHMELYERNHPSGRHSKANWSNPTDTSSTTTTSFSSRTSTSSGDHDPPLSKAMINEVVLQAGDVLYLPTYWFHMIISLNINYQCNSRSGVTNENHHFLEECGMEMK